jgi:hypothetical protein
MLIREEHRQAYIIPSNTLRGAFLARSWHAPTTSDSLRNRHPVDSPFYLAAEILFDREERQISTLYTIP